MITTDQCDEKLQLVLQKHSNIFSSELGCLQGTEIKLLIDPQAKPKFHKARAVPYALKGLVEKELEHLQKSGIITPVQISKWAAPIVPVLKHVGTMRICGDYKVTINQVSRVDSYLPFTQN